MEPKLEQLPAQETNETKTLIGIENIILESNTMYEDSRTIEGIGKNVDRVLNTLWFNINTTPDKYTLIADEALLLQTKSVERLKHEFDKLEKNERYGGAIHTSYLEENEKLYQMQKRRAVKQEQMVKLCSLLKGYEPWMLAAIVGEAFDFSFRQARQMAIHGTYKLILKGDIPVSAKEQEEAKRLINTISEHIAQWQPKL